MAGGGAAFQRLEKPDNLITQSAQYWGGLASQENEAEKGRQERRGQEDRARKERLDAARKKEIKDWEEQYSIKDGDYAVKDTGWKSETDIMRDTSAAAIAKNAELNRLALQARMRGDNEAARKYEMDISKLKNFFGNIKNAQARLSDLHKDYVTRAQNGDIANVDADKWEGDMQMLNDGTYEVGINENMEPVLKGVVKNSDGTTTPSEIKYSSIIDGSYRARSPVKLVGKDGFVQQVVNQLGKRTYDTRSGYTTTTKQVWDEEAIAGADAAIDTLLSSEDKSGAVYYDLFKERIPIGQELTSSQKTKVKKELMDMIKSGYDQSIKIDYDSGAARADRDAAKAAEKSDPYSAKHYDIIQAMENNDFSQFGGDLTWEGKKYSTTGAASLHPNGKEIIIPVQSTDKDGKVTTTSLRVPKTERSISQLIDGFTGKVVDFDKTMKSKPYAYRDVAPQINASVGDLVGKFFKDGDTTLIGNKQSDFVKALSKEFPDAIIKGESSEWGRRRFWNTNNWININGQDVQLDNNANVIQDIEEALKVNKKQTPSTPEGTGRQKIDY